MEMRDIGDSRRELRLGHNGDNVRGDGGWNATFSRIF